MKFIWNEHKSIFLHFPLIFLWFIKNRMKLKGEKTELSKTEFRLNNFITISNFQHLLLMHLWNHYPRTSFLKRENTYISGLYLIGHGIRKMYFEIAAFFEFCRRNFQDKEIQMKQKISNLHTSVAGSATFLWILPL